MIMAADEQVIATVSTLVLLLMVYLPVIVVNAWKYAQNCHHIVYQKRHARITLYVVILVVIHILFKCTTLVIQYLVPRSVGDSLGRLELVSRCIHSVVQDLHSISCELARPNMACGQIKQTKHGLRLNVKSRSISPFYIAGFGGFGCCRLSANSWSSSQSTDGRPYSMRSTNHSEMCWPRMPGIYRIKRTLEIPHFAENTLFFRWSSCRALFALHFMAISLRTHCPKRWWLPALSWIMWCRSLCWWSYSGPFPKCGIISIFARKWGTVDMLLHALTLVVTRTFSTFQLFWF